MCKFPAPIAFHKVTNGQVDIKPQKRWDDDDAYCGSHDDNNDGDDDDGGDGDEDDDGDDDKDR